MASPLTKLKGVKAITENETIHVGLTGHSPYFSLTPAGANALKQHIIKVSAKYTRVGGECGVNLGLDTDVLRDFLSKEMGVSIKDTSIISKLLGCASKGFNTYGTDMIAIDSVALDIIAGQKTSGRQK